jgi:DNA-binding response OmpR family regulator
MSGARILVVDDQEDIRDMARMILARAGHDVATAVGGEAALAALRRSRFDLVLLDINMPGMDGWTTLDILRQDDAIASTPVAMFSIKGDVRDRVHGLQRGVVDYIAKPFGVDELAERVARVLEAVRRRARV